MPQVDLSTLGGQELRRLLDSSRRRGQAALSYQILQEMAARREQREQRPGPSFFASRRAAAAEPRVIALDLSDPMGAEAEAEAEAEAVEARPEPEAPPAAAWEDPTPADPEAPLTLRPDPPPLPPRRGPPERRTRRSPWAAAGFVAGLAVGVVVGLGVAQETRPLASPPIAPPAAAPPVQAAPVPPAPVVAEAAPVSQAAAELPPPPPPPTAADAAPAAVAAATPPPAPEAAQAPEAAAAPIAAASDCAGAPTPADRTICQDPRLQRLQRELRQAYARALDAHEDRALLREHQLAWRDGRNEVADPDRLAQLYEERIRKLDAATAEARRLH